MYDPHRIIVQLIW